MIGLLIAALEKLDIEDSTVVDRLERQQASTFLQAF
jgi:hypothetical protein